MLAPAREHPKLPESETANLTLTTGGGLQAGAASRSASLHAPQSPISAPLPGGQPYPTPIVASPRARRPEFSNHLWF